MNYPLFYIEPLEGSGRAAERRAILRLIERAFGPGHTYSHHPDGAPAIDVEGIEISVSHCRRCAALAIADRAIGVDVETRRPQLERVAPRVLSADEIECYAGSLEQAWTLKEAIYKAARTPGLDFRRDIRLPLDGSNVAAVISSHTPRPRLFDIVESRWLGIGDVFMSLVVAAR